MSSPSNDQSPGRTALESLRDRLALDRTMLANERTLLAYVRTALSLVAGAAVIFHFFPTVQSYVVAAWIMAASGIVVLSVGIYRYRSVSRRLRADDVTG